MVVIRTFRGGHRYKAKKSRSALGGGLGDLPQLLSLFLVASVAFYGGVLVGMQMNSCPTTTTTTVTSPTDELPTKSPRGDEDDKDFAARVRAEVEHRLATELEKRLQVPSSSNKDDKDFDARVRAEVERRLATELEKQLQVPSSSNNHGGKGGKNDKKDDGRPRRFPKTVSKFATGASLVGKNDFLSEFDNGIPKPPEHERNPGPGKNDVLVLYGSAKALPDVDAGTVYVDENGDDSSIPHMAARDATKNCGGLNVVFTGVYGAMEQCIAIVGNYESYHVQRWLRINPAGGSNLDASLPLTPVGRGLQTNGKDKFLAPTDRFALGSQALLETYFQRLDDTLEALKPMAEACAGSDNTVIVMVCNTGHAELLVNFLCAARARGFGDVAKEKLLVFATDEGALKIAEGLGLRTFYDEKVFEKMPEKEAAQYGDWVFAKMMYAKVVAVQLVNRLGHDVLFQDVDLVWYKNPIPLFHNRTNPLHNFDVLFQDDGARSLRYAPYNANTGFYYVRNNDKTKFLFRSLLYLGDMVLSMTSHQQALAALLDEHSSLTGLRVKTLSLADFPGGYHYHRKNEIPFLKDVVRGKYAPYVLHMSWTKNKKYKMLFLQQMGLWYTNEKCQGQEGVTVAKGLTSKGGLEAECCSAEPIVKCHYSDKPSVEKCKGSNSPLLDHNGKSFW